MYTLGVNPADIYDPDTIEEHGKSLGLGTRAVNQDGNEYLLLEAAGAIATLGNIGFWDEDFVFTLLSTSNDVAGTPVAGNAGLPTAAGQRFWAQTYGMGVARVLADAAADTRLNTTGTAGALDDDGGTGDFVVEGLNLMVTEPDTATASIAARYSYPHLAWTAIEAVE